ncbi:helix-turn-helix transcriptional regulator [bacterium]|nr:helix-turn-helix transcriptional regulator [bacterium]
MEKGDILKVFGKNLRAERNRVGLSQEQLAEKIGLSYGQVIGTIERGETNTSLSVIVSIMNALDLDFDKLFDRKKFIS